MMARISVNIYKKGFGSVQSFYGSQIKKLGDIRAPLMKSGNVMLASVHRNFRASGRPRKWAPLARTTLIRKLREGLSPLPLIGRTGRLQSQVTFRAGAKKLSIGTSIPYAKYHQFGRGRMHRPFLVFQDEDLRRIETLVIQHVLGANYRIR